MNNLRMKLLLKLLILKFLNFIYFYLNNLYKLFFELYEKKLLQKLVKLYFYEKIVIFNHNGNLL